MLQRIFPINVAPTWMNKNTVFFTNIACELVFLYLCYALYVVPNIKLFYAIPALLVLRWLVNWMAKMRAVGVYIFHLKDQIHDIDHEVCEHGSKRERVNEVFIHFQIVLKKWKVIPSIKDIKQAHTETTKYANN